LQCGRMAKGIAITITRVIDHVRDPLPDDPRFHRVWNGTEWVSLATSIWSPGLAEKAGVKPSVHSTRLEFLPPGIVPKDVLVYRRTLMKEMQKKGLIR
jgi:hypothetical protein